MPASKSKTYRELNSVDLLTWFIELHPGAHISKGRDAHFLKRFLDETGILPTQILEGMSSGYGCRSIPIFLNCVDQWLMEDSMEQEASLAVFLSGKDPPPCYYTYRDLKDSGIENAEMEQAWNRASKELEQYTDDACNTTATVGNRSRVTRSYRLKHGSVAFDQQRGPSE